MSEQTNNITVSDDNGEYEIVFSVTLSDGGLSTHKLLGVIQDLHRELVKAIEKRERKGWVYL